jgi:uncharacterized membrane protein YphA (DoxX/SURF4 family)
MAKWKRGGYFAAVIGTAILGYAILFGYYTRIKTFLLIYFPENTYQPASNFPNVDGQGQPKVVMVRKSGEIASALTFFIPAS